MTARAIACMAALVLAAAAATALAEAPRRISVLAEPGETSRVATELRKGALRVVRRRGRSLEVVASRARTAALSRLPGVATAAEAPTAFADEVLSEGVGRSGAGPMIDVGNGGRGLTIAVLDLGFGSAIDARQAAGELPPDSRLELVAFDPVRGIAGANAYGNATNHGELVAQTVYDYAPKARYIFVSYHSEADFLIAADWIVARRPDIVIHSNSFIEGSFDGTGPEAQAVDRAAAAGILWFNSAGNYAESHWSASWADTDGDGVLDLGSGGVFERQAGAPITFALSWPAPDGDTPTDLDLVLERQASDGTWAPVRSSSDAQSDGARPSERIVGYVPGETGLFRVLVVHASGPEPVGPLSLFSREIPLAAFGGSAVASVPTPGDAAGSITVGAVDWRGNTLKSYSSQGPTLDGRPKPDLVAPTNTRILGPSGPRSVGGTSNAAPNAAGVAAVLLSAQRSAGIPFSYDALRGTLEGTALDLGDPGPDPAFGLGRVRADVDAPELVLLEPAPGAAVRGAIRVRPLIADDAGVAQWAIRVDGAPVADRRSAVGSVRLDTRTLGDGLHTIAIAARDMPGNAGEESFAIEVDNTRPRLAVQRVVAGPRRRPRGVAGESVRPPDRLPSGGRRLVRVVVSAQDGGRRPTRLELRLADGRGRLVARRSLATRSTLGRTITLGRLPAGRYRMTLDLADAAGNARALRRIVRVR